MIAALAQTMKLDRHSLVNVRVAPFVRVPERVLSARFFPEIRCTFGEFLPSIKRISYSTSAEFLTVTRRPNLLRVFKDLEPHRRALFPLGLPATRQRQILPLALAFHAAKSVHGTVVVQAGPALPGLRPNPTERKQRAE